MSVHAFAEPRRREAASRPMRTQHAHGGGGPRAPAERSETASQPVPGMPPLTAAPATTAVLSWTFLKTHPWDALWYFCGEHPSGFSTTVLLRAAGLANTASLTWSIPHGGDKIEFSGGATGEDVRVSSKAGSARPDDITVRVTEGTSAGAPSYDGTLTVRKPHRLLPRSVRHHPNCPPVAVDRACPAGAAAHWTEFGYRIVDNVGGTIVGATVNETFPSAKVDDRPNSWWRPAAAPSAPHWRNTNGTFIDYWWVWGNAPLPVHPGDPHDNDSVDRAAHEFFIGSPTPGRGCRVQTHTAHRYLGHTVHENIRTPAP